MSKIILFFKQLFSFSKVRNQPLSSNRIFDYLTPASNEAEEFYEKEILLQSDIDAENDVYPSQ